LSTLIICSNFRDVVIGISYTVDGQNPLCPGLNNNQQTIVGQLQNSFEKNLLNDLCNCGYSFHQYRHPTRSFFTVDLIGDLNANEPVYTNLIRTSIMNAWQKTHIGLSNINAPDLSKKFFQRIGSLGTLISRIYYTIRIDNQLVQVNFQTSPSIERIETEFNNLGSDLRVYPSCNSVAKALFSSVYIRVDESTISAGDRQIIELNIRIGLTQTKVIFSTTKNEVTVVYSERYQGQTRGYNVLRVYYAVS